MLKCYYLDSCIWRDYHENRFSPKGKPIGKYALLLFMKIIKKKEIIIFSELTIKELKISLTDYEINDLLNVLFLSNILKRVCIESEDYAKAKERAIQKKLPVADVLHALTAARYNAIIITRDKHFNDLRDIAEVRKPEEI